MAGLGCTIRVQEGARFQGSFAPSFSTSHQGFYSLGCKGAEIKALQNKHGLSASVQPIAVGFRARGEMSVFTLHPCTPGRFAWSEAQMASFQGARGCKIRIQTLAPRVRA